MDIMKKASAKLGDAAKKTFIKIEKEQDKLSALMAKRDEFTANYQAKLSEMSREIVAQKKVIADLKEQENQEKLIAVNKIFEKKGITADDLLTAAINGNLYELQERLEKENSAKESSVIIKSNDVVEENEFEDVQAEYQKQENDFEFENN